MTELCREYGIEIETLGIERENYSLPEYKAAMQEVDSLEQQAETLERYNELLENHNKDLECRLSELNGQAQEIEMCNQEMELQGEKLLNQIEELERKEKDSQQILAKHDLRADMLKVISKEVKSEIKKTKSVAVPMINLFSSEEYVKVKKSDWKIMLDVFDKAASRNYLLERYEKKISNSEKQIAMLADQTEKLKCFVASRELGEEFVEYVKSLAPKTMKQRLEQAKADAIEYNRQRKGRKQEIDRKNKQWQQEM